MIRKKYHKLDLSDVDSTWMEGYNVLDPVNGSDPQKGQVVEETILEEATTD